MRHYLAILIAVIALAVPWFVLNYPVETGQIVGSFRNFSDQLASIIIAHKPKSIEDLQNKYEKSDSTRNPKIKILLVPGHEPGFGGTEFGAIAERDLVVDMAAYLAIFLRNDGRYEVLLSRTKNDWATTFSDYFNTNWAEIIAWRKAYKEEARTSSIGQSPKIPTVAHNNAPTNVAYRLFGISKWANENDVDIILHMHINDYPGRNWNSPGQYSGFSIYIPEKQFYNSTTTRAIAQDIFDRLAKYNPVTDLPVESEGIIEELELIAVGVDNTSDAPSMLIEYGYIYEPQFTNPDIRNIALQDLAYQTYLGLQDFFDPEKAKQLASTYDTLLMPYEWNATTTAGGYSKDIFALQTALVVEGVYPPTPYSKNDCPRTGKLGPCTKSAVNLFQKKHGITGETGIIGQKTIEKLNQLY